MKKVLLLLTLALLPANSYAQQQPAVDPITLTRVLNNLSNQLQTMKIFQMKVAREWDALSSAAVIGFRGGKCPDGWVVYPGLDGKLLAGGGKNLAPGDNVLTTPAETPLDLKSRPTEKEESVPVHTLIFCQKQQ